MLLQTAYVNKWGKPHLVVFHGMGVDFNVGDTTKRVQERCVISPTHSATDNYSVLINAVILTAAAKVKERIVLSETHFRTTGRHLSMGSHSVICHPTEVTAPPSTQPGWQVGTRLIDDRKDERLSLPSWLVTYRNGLPVHRRSPIPVLTGSDVAQLR